MPVATYVGSTCGLMGSSVPLLAAHAGVMYPTHADYVTRVRAAAERAVTRGYLLPKDAVSTSKVALTGTAVESAKLGQSLVGATKVRLVILDACRNNPTASRSLGGNTRGFVRETSASSTQVVTRSPSDTAPKRMVLDSGAYLLALAMRFT